LPENTVKAFLDALASGDLVAAAEFTDVGIEEMIDTTDDEESRELVTAIFSRLTYELGSSTIQGNNATVKATIVAPDLLQITVAVMMDVLQQAFSLAFSGATEEEMNALFMDSFRSHIENKDAPLLTTVTDIKLTLRSGKWVIEPDDTLASALTGNLSQALEELEDD